MPDDYIKILPATGTWVVRAAGAVLGESNRALELVEGNMPPVIYFPREDFAMAFLDKSDLISSCPHKGQATHYTIVAKSGPLRDAAWSYENPKDGVAAIKGYLAFYTNKVAVENV